MAIVAAVLIGLAALSYMVFWCCFCVPLFECVNDQPKEVFSPDGTLKAVTFRRGCGATTRDSTQVSVLPAVVALPKESGNVLVLESQAALQIQWIGARELKISGTAGAGIAHSEHEHLGVRITYE